MQAILKTRLQSGETLQDALQKALARMPKKPE